MIVQKIVYIEKPRRAIRLDCFTGFYMRIITTEIVYWLSVEFLLLNET